MPVFDPTVTAAEPAKRIDATMRAVRGRRVPPSLESIEELKKKKIHIFNVGPWAQVIPTGSTGTFVIPPCPKGKQFVEMVPPLSLIMEELVITSETDYARLQEDGWNFAKELLGEGRGQNPANNKRRFGIGIAQGEQPTAAELDEARAQLHATCSEIIADIRRLWDVDKATAHNVLKASGAKVQHIAAEVLGLDNEEWMTKSTPSTNTKCPMCRVSVEAEAPICHNCKSVVNEEAYLAMRTRQQSLEEATAPKAKAK